MSFSAVQDLDLRLTAFDAQTLALEDQRPHPPQAALSQLGQVLMTELVDLMGDTALEDFQTVICEALIGAFHSAAQRIEREADRGRDQLQALIRDFDGSEVADGDLQMATFKVGCADVAVLAVELVRDAAAQAYTAATGEVWSPWRGSVRPSRTTAAQISARDAITAARTRRQQALDPGRAVVAFRAAPQADTALDAGRIFDALNWALSEWPGLALATTGAKGAERLAMKWAAQRGVAMVIARPDFDRNGRAAPFRANDELLELAPVCVLTLANTLDLKRRANFQPFGPALNLGQKAQEAGLRHVAVRPRA